MNRTASSETFFWIIEGQFWFSSCSFVLYYYVGTIFVVSSPFSLTFAPENYTRETSDNENFFFAPLSPPAPLRLTCKPKPTLVYTSVFFSPLQVWPERSDEGDLPVIIVYGITKDSKSVQNANVSRFSSPISWLFLRTVSKKFSYLHFFTYLQCQTVKLIDRPLGSSGWCLI